MTDALFVTDLHGLRHKYLKLFDYLKQNTPDILFLGGDLLPPACLVSDSMKFGNNDFIHNFLAEQFSSLKKTLAESYPMIVSIMGNDDPRYLESAFLSAGRDNLWTYINQRKIEWKGFSLFGYNFVPPSPFMLKDWERYDVSRFTDPGCVSPEEGRRTFPVSEHDMKWTTIKEDLDNLITEKDLSKAIILFHTPPYGTYLDLGDVGGQMIEHISVDEHLGSIAVKRFIEERQPLITLHGHIHESSRMSGKWMEKIGGTFCINGAHDGDELAVIRLNPENPSDVIRELI